MISSKTPMVVPCVIGEGEGQKDLDSPRKRTGGVESCRERAKLYLPRAILSDLIQLLGFFRLGGKIVWTSASAAEHGKKSNPKFQKILRTPCGQQEP